MMPMQFWSKLVRNRNNWRLRLSQAGFILMIFCFCAGKMPVKMGVVREWTTVGMLAGLGVALIGGILMRRKMATAQVTDTDIIVTIEEIRIGGQRFPVSEVEYLDFLVNSYDGMPGPRARHWGTFLALTGRRMSLTGCDNKLMFTADGKQHSYSFFLEDEMAMRRLGMLFREFYSRGLRFRERNRGGRTFMFAQVIDRKAFERTKREAGYE